AVNLYPAFRQLWRQSNDFPRRGFGIVGIDEEDESLGPGFGKRLESGDFIVEGLNEGMRHRAEYRNPVELAGGHRRCSGISDDVAGPRRHETSLGSMGSPQAEVDELLTGCQQHMAGRLGCDQRL